MKPYFEKMYFIGIFVLNVVRMIQATLHIDSEKKWAAIRAMLDAMDVAYDTQEPVKEFSDKEQVLLERAEADVVEGRLHKFKSHREILGR